MKSTKLRITFIDFDDIKNPLLAGGQATATSEVGRELIKMGHQVTVICSKYPGYIDRVENGIKYKHVGLGVKNIKLNNAVFFVAAPLAVKKIKNADLIVECFTAPISTLFSPLFTRIPVIVLPSMFNADEFSKKYHLPLYLIERIGIKFYKYFLPYSDIDSSKIKRLNPKAEFKIVPQGVSRDFFKIKHQKPEHILFLGRFDIGQKGIDLLLKAYARVSKEIKYPLVLAGHGPDQDKIQKIIKLYKLEDKVKIVGSAYGLKKNELISKAIFVAFPSRHDEISLWSLEALASGMPLVSFDLPETKWVSNRVSLKAKAFNINDYAKLLVKATTSELNKKMRKDARILASKYRWEKVAGEFEKFMNMVLIKEGLS